MIDPNKLKDRWQKEDEAAINSGLEQVLASGDGRKFLWWLLQIGRIGDQPFRPDPYATSFACGELNIGNQILARTIEVSPGGYLNLMQEMQNEHRTRAESLIGTDSGSDSEPGPEPEPEFG